MGKIKELETFLYKMRSHPDFIAERLMSASPAYILEYLKKNKGKIEFIIIVKKR